MAIRVIPNGERILVKPIIEEDDITARAKAAGIAVVVMEENKPSPTTGHIVAIGSGPLVQESFVVGDKVVFSRLCRNYVRVEGEEYLTLQFDDVITILRQEEKPPEEPRASLPEMPKAPY